MRLYLQQTDSTNRVAKEQALAGAASGSVVWADSQLGGKGQHGRSFASPKGGLYFSLIVRPALLPERLPLLTLATGLACREVLARDYDLDAKLKWPNDLFLQGKKVGGILCETFFETQMVPMQATVIIGVGINCNNTPEDFPAELRPLVTTLAEWLHAPIVLSALLENLVEEILATIQLLHNREGSLLDRWQDHDYLYGQPLRYLQGNDELIGIGRGIRDDGRYRMVDAQGREHAILGGQLRPLHWPDDCLLRPHDRN